MEKLCKQIANRIGAEIDLGEEQRSIVEYGVFAVLQILLAIIFVTIFGFLLGVAIEGLVILFISSILRKYSGGAHASTPEICLFIGTVVCLVLANISNYFYNNIKSIWGIIIVGMVIFIWSYYIVMTRVPLDNPKKQITNIKKRKVLKRKTNCIISIYLMIVIIGILQNNKNIDLYIICIYIGVWWQMFTVSRHGEKIINKIDKIIYLFLYINKEE